ncbi:MAG: hypothetical protein A2940_02740 [Candidatus Wildermuthbacteria bacterium RIFCSPLOWO2_01_FULL_48_29]|uniref:Uncharacterized protein n=1 Tax=Candidatus Wildermuthbacteria bacterium RIFCSPLOWO2_01_FULL_48_29 TaxID=1802462 RepID=A0A1G2RNF3_9BACT|nr:MAG: hypothetical protein A2940_02740 [Candidatus Wildermuthbacteria bacterium RIFCSPLOWO2_01_FULL_48_29]
MKKRLIREDRLWRRNTEGQELQREEKKVVLILRFKEDVIQNCTNIVIFGKRSGNLAIAQNFQN